MHSFLIVQVFNGLGGGENAGSQIPVSDRDPSVFYQATAPAIAEAFVALAKVFCCHFMQHS